MSSYSKEVPAYQLNQGENFKSRTGLFFKCLGHEKDRVKARKLFPPNIKETLTFSNETRVFVKKKGGKNA